MATPLNKTILDEIDARLKKIVIADGSSNTIVTVKRARLEPFKGHDLPAVNYWPTQMSNAMNQYGNDTRELMLVVEAHTKTRDEPFVDVCDRLAADIVTVLNRKTTASKVSDPLSADLGGIVDNFTCTNYVYQIGQGQDPFCGIILTFAIQFSTTITKMYS